MTASHLTAADFSSYPPLARKIATDHLALFKEMPVSFLAAYLRELIAYDWKFPEEKRELEAQLAYVAALPIDARQQLLKRFAAIRLSPELDQIDWVRQPRDFSEAFSAHVWATHQINEYRSAATEFFQNATIPGQTLPVHRLALVVIGQGVAQNRYPLFQKLRKNGTYFSRVKAPEGLAAMVGALRSRAEKYPVPYAHWYLDGAVIPGSESEVSCVSYASLTAARARLQQRMQRAFESAMPPEQFRSMLARIEPEELGFSSSGETGLINRFQVSLLTEGAGAQIYSTVFVQWAAREVLRRARPLTLLARFTPRQRERPMSELLSEAHGGAVFDPEGSLIDADMSAFYTWINLRRLDGAEQSRFLVWFEDHEEALAVAPDIAAGVQLSGEIEIRDLLGKLGATV
jgi:hypothetical protein